jgi:protocatechuate 3,4-dioxygenase beta subunit
MFFRRSGRVSTSLKNRRSSSSVRAKRLFIEPLEHRRLLTLLGVSPSFPTVTYDSTGQITYNATTHEFDLTGSPLLFRASASSPIQTITAPRSVSMQIDVDNSGNLINDGQVSDFTVTGNIPANPSLSGTLLTGKIIEFGYQNTGSGTAEFDFIAIPLGGTLFSMFAGQDIGITSASEGAFTFNDFTTDFGGGAKGTIGSVPLATGNITGSKFTDITGDGFSSDDTPLGGVAINLYQDLDQSGTLTAGDGPAIATTTTAADGSYSFNNLLPGTYFVQESVPAGYTQTAGGTYTVNVTAGSTSTGNNFDDFQNISISGTKYNDLTGNSFSSDDTGLGGVTINLYENGGTTPVATTTTAADGSYSFANLGPGTYSVQETVPAGSTQTGGNAGYTVSATSGTNSIGNNFDDFQNISISGTKYNDLTGNSFSSDDTGLGGVTINLYKNGGTTAVASTVTASNGTYSFTNLGPGTYSVQEVVPLGSTQTGGIGGYTITATSGGNCMNKNFDDFQNISISGTKYKDITGNGFSSDDTGLGGVTINLYKNGGTTPVATTTTAADGSYSFANLGPGTYSVQETVPAGSTQTGGNAGYTVSATSGTNSTGNNFDDFQNISISGTKYKDITGNSFSSDDTGLGGVTINLYKNGGTTPVASTVTASNGTYSFANLGPGTYSVQEVVPAGYTQTGGVGGYSISATSGTNSTGNNFDDFQNVNISGTKFTDITGNGFSSDDTVLGGVTINLYKNGGTTPVASTVTASNGTYSFANLGPGTYKVQEVVPTGWTQTGGVGGYTISVTCGNNSTGDNFDDFQNISISGTKYKDITGNGFSSDDTGLSGVTIKLYKNGGTTAVASTVTASNGTYSFANLGPGTYSVQEVVPAGYTQTGGVGGYSISATSGSSYTGKNFDDFQNVTISGTKYNDLTGNGFSSDDTGLGGVTVKLFKDANNDGVLTSADGNAVATTTTASNGTYSFGNVAPGTYFVQEVVPTGYIQTGGGPNGSAGSTYYTLAVQCGQTYTGDNFDDYMIPTCTPKSYSFTVNNGSSSKTVSTLTGNTAQGDTVTVNFTTGTMADTLTLVSYIAPGSTYNQSTAYQQQIFDVETITVPANSSGSLTVVIPNSDYQIDFICGTAINTLAPQTYNGNPYGPDSSNILYSSESRLLSADNSGNNTFTTKSVAAKDFGKTTFWSSTNGQNLIKQLNGSASATNLAQWLAQTFPNLYGVGTGTHSLVNSNGTYFTDTQVAAAYSKFSGSDQQTLAAALSVYSTSTGLAGSTATTYAKSLGMNVSLYGSSMDTISVGTSGAAFGVANNTTLTVMQLLVDINADTNLGSPVSSSAGMLFSTIETSGLS